MEGRLFLSKHYVVVDRRTFKEVIPSFPHPTSEKEVVDADVHGEEDIRPLM